MRIKKLALNNFGIYSGISTLDFTSSKDKPLILIGGMNGRGKTTIFEAILLVLYGKRSFMIEERGLSYTKYLRQLVNMTDGTGITEISLEFSLARDNDEFNYTITRGWGITDSSSGLRTSVSKDGRNDIQLAENWDFFVEEILPCALAPFFFFNGEKLADLANASNDVYMKNSIKSLLGIDIVEAAISDLQRLNKKKSKQLAALSYSSDLEKYDAEFAMIDKELKSSIGRSGLLEAKRIRLENELKQAEYEFASMGGTFALRHQELVEQRDRLQEKLQELNTSVTDIAAGDLPLILVLPLLQRTLCAAKTEKEQLALQATLECMPDLFRKYSERKHISLNIDDFTDYIKDSMPRDKPIFNLTDNGLERLQVLLSGQLESQLAEAMRLLAMRATTLVEVEDNENYLSISIDEKRSEAIYKRILQLTSEIAIIGEKYRAEKENEEALNRRYEGLRNQQLKSVEQAISVIEGEEDDKRILSYSGRVSEILKIYELRLQALKLNELAQIMSGCFSKLLSKQSLISNIKIDNDTMEFHYYNLLGDEVDFTSLSAGEKQLLVIALLWALRISSRKQFPVIIDTPLARLDSTHRKALVQNYFPEAGEQLILLSTDEEIYGELYNLLEPLIGNAYTIKYIDSENRSIIESGYFRGSEKCL